MTLGRMLLKDFEHEMPGARRTLERVPEDRLDWRPHPESMTMGRLAGHVAELPVWAVSSSTASAHT